MSRQWIVMAVVIIITGIYAAGRHTVKNKKICVSAVTVFLALFSGLRSWWFGDLIKYYTSFLWSNGDNWKEYVLGDFGNNGLKIVFKICGALGISYDVLLFAIAAFVAITLGIVIYRYSPSPYWSYLMYIAMGFYIFTYSGLKQAIAMGFCCLAFCSLMEDDLRHFILWVVVGALFHAPAAIFLLAYPFARKKIDFLYYVIIAVSLALIFAFRNQIVSFLSEMYYEDEDIYEASKLVGGRFLMMLFILAVSVVMRPIKNADKIYRYTFNTMVIAALIQTFSVFDNNFTRLADYYYQFIVVLIPLMLEPVESQRRANPELHIVRRFDNFIYLGLGTAITLFALWFYNNQLNGVLINTFRFFWEVNGHALYGL